MTNRVAALLQACVRECEAGGCCLNTAGIIMVWYAQKEEREVKNKKQYAQMICPTSG